MPGNGDAGPVVEPKDVYEQILSSSNVRKRMATFRKALGGVRGHSSGASMKVRRRKSKPPHKRLRITPAVFGWKMPGDPAVSRKTAGRNSDDIVIGGRK
jgi:hypothetical protein